MDTSIYPPKFSKVLLTPDPHYIPGYTGYCPQLKYNYGKSYGKLTAELLTSPEVAHSGRLMVSGLPLSTEAVGQGYNRTTPIPGYTGFIPRGRSQFACSYSEMCRKALTDFYHEQQKMSLQKSDKLPVISKYNNYSAQQFQRSSPPLTAINSLISYKPALPFIPIERPYLMDDNNPQKCFISGFTGHVPKARFLIGKGYPITTHQALVQFGKPFSEEPVKEQDSPTIYPKGAVVPSFTGHIPGYRFLYGHTFGQLSQNALEKCGIRRVAREA